MSDRAREILETLLGIDVFKTNNPDIAGIDEYIAELFAQNKANSERLEQAGVKRITANSAGKSGTMSKRAEARELESDLRRIGSTARTIKRKNPNFENKFIIPSGGLNYEEVIQYGESVLANLPDAAVEFAKLRLTKTFFDNFRLELNQFRGTTEGQESAKLESVGETANIGDILDDSLANREELNTAMENELAGNSEKLAEWRSAKRIERRRAKPANKPEKPA